jgi:flavorubredoxin
VWTPFQDELIANIEEVLDPAKIDIIVANHAEVDHSGALGAVIRHAPKATVIVSKRGLESVRGHYHQDWNFKAVQTGDRVSLGRNELVFVEAPMLHWPDSMFTYLTGHNILFPNDAFGQHYATAGRFNDEVDQDELYEEALKYYANILTPFSALVTKKIDEVLALKLPVDMIAPSHGVLWRDEPLQIVRKYQEWAAQKLFRSGRETLNNGVLPTLLPILEDIKGLKFKNRLGGAFGTYGWSGESVKIIEERLADAGVSVVAEGVRCKWQPDAEGLESCRAFGRELGEATKGA